MKISRIHLKTGSRLGILENFEHTFSNFGGDQLEPICLIGDNGAGKSKLIQCIVEIFYALDSRYREFEPDAKAEISFTFELDYTTEFKGGSAQIHILQEENKKAPQVFFRDNEGELKPIKEPRDICAALPQFIVGYTSGENETLSTTFSENSAFYAEHVGSAAVDQSSSVPEVPDSRFVMMDYEQNFSVVAACFLLSDSHSLKVFEDPVGTHGLHSFRLLIKFYHQAAKRIGGVKRTEQLDRYVENFKKCSTCWDYDEAAETWTFDFLVTPETKKAFKKYFLSPYALFRALQRLEMLNSLMIPKKVRESAKKKRLTQRVASKPPAPADEDRVFQFEYLRLNLKNVSKPVDYVALSDGEHQFLHVFGSMMIFNDNNILFVFDEPESHFNPKWRIEFVSTLNKILRGEHHCLFLTTHAPFVPSDIHQSNVYIFRRDKDGSVIMSPPKEETYGASFNRILGDVFGIVPPPISRVSLADIIKLQKSDDPDYIESRLRDFGDSMERFSLLERIEELRAKKD